MSRVLVIQRPALSIDPHGCRHVPATIIPAVCQRWGPHALQHVRYWHAPLSRGLSLWGAGHSARLLLLNAAVTFGRRNGPGWRNNRAPTDKLLCRRLRCDILSFMIAKLHGLGQSLACCDSATRFPFRKAAECRLAAARSWDIDYYQGMNIVAYTVECDGSALQHW
jgi:hypothetical protein